MSKRVSPVRLVVGVGLLAMLGVGCTIKDPQSLWAEPARPKEGIGVDG